VFRILRHPHAVEVVSCFHMWIVDFISNLIYLLRSYDHVAWAYIKCYVIHRLSDISLISNELILRVIYTDYMLVYCNYQLITI